MRWLVVFAVPWVVYLALVYARRPAGGTAWFTFTFSRPIQIESFSGLGAMWAIGFGSTTWRIQFLHGLNSADLVLGPHLKGIHLGLEVLGVVALAVVGVRLWRGRRDPDRPEGRRVLGVSLEQALSLQAIVLLVLIVAGPVFSPQYMAWFAPVFAVAAGEGLLGRETVLLGGLLRPDRARLPPRLRRIAGRQLPGADRADRAGTSSSSPCSPCACGTSGRSRGPPPQRRTLLRMPADLHVLHDGYARDDGVASTVVLVLDG